MASVYLPYEEANPPAQSVQDLISYCREAKIELILGCDSNAHHTVWGSTNVNSRGKALSEYLSYTSLNILNKGNAPTFINRLRSEVIDITLATLAIEIAIRN